MSSHLPLSSSPHLVIDRRFFHLLFISEFCESSMHSFIVSASVFVFLFPPYICISCSNRKCCVYFAHFLDSESAFLRFRVFVLCCVFAFTPRHHHFDFVRRRPASPSLPSVLLSRFSFLCACARKKRNLSVICSVLFIISPHELPLSFPWFDQMFYSRVFLKNHSDSDSSCPFPFPFPSLSSDSDSSV